ncbi:hypothetical protein IAI10_16330 [Clostridium sp. 19966]|uniref:hypothetical protein n=1 Tax=Clostridium sp. 19966 TaxID=2768166 RepID=UPI0028DEE1C7|nr:hypothetical protein [Clostridium sp. 19966]MDT8718235.1 hypothetical protein [Clostridium sp. 19966]
MKIIELLKKFPQVLHASVKVKVIAMATVAVVGVGGVTTAAVIVKNNTQNTPKAEATAKADTKDINVTSDIGKNNEDQSQAQSLDSNQQNQPTTQTQSQSNNSNTPNEANSQKAASTDTSSNTTNSNNSSTKKTSSAATSSITQASAPAATPKTSPTPAPAPAPKPAPTPAPAPTRQSGIDEDLTNQINNQYTIPVYERNKQDPRTQSLVKLARSVVTGNLVIPDDVKNEWCPYTSDPSTKFKYIKYSVNVVTGESQYYYTRFPEQPGAKNGFNYVVAYWDASINNYKMYYIKIQLL